MAAVSITESSIRRTADPLSYKRGESYAQSGRVRDLTTYGVTVQATVDGGSPHHVQLTITKAGIRGHCTCPYGQKSVFCKHCVATALTWLEEGDDLDEETAEHEVTDEQLLAFLERQDPAWLAEHLLHAAADDPLLRARLEVAAGSRPDVYDTSHVRNRLVNAIAIDDFVDYRNAYSYVTHVHEALDEVEELTGDGFPDAAVELAEFALDLLEEAIELVDDSDGGVRGALGRAQEIHLDACHAGHPDPKELADRLATRALTSDWKVFLDAIPAFADVLGPRGMARYREHVETAWRALSPREPGQSDGFRPRYLMERLAEHEGGTNAPDRSHRPGR